MSDQRYRRADPERLRANVPAEMRELSAWLLWAEAPPEKPDEKPKKVPYYVDGQVRSGRMDTAEDRGRLVKFGDALAEYERERRRWAGVGVALGPVPPIVLAGIDLDGCVQQEGHTLTSDASKVVAASDGAYTEISPSGRGVKLFGTGDVGTTKRDTAGLEIYSSRRFFTVTGERFAGGGLTSLFSAAEVARKLFSKEPASSAAIERGRNNALTSHLGSLRARGATDDELLREALRFNAERCRPPLAEDEVRGVVRSAMTWARNFALTDLGNAERLANAFGADWRFLPDLGWCRWEGQRWVEDRERRIMMIAAEVARAIYSEAAATTDESRRRAVAGWAVKSESRRALEAMTTLAQSRPTIVDLLERYDLQPMLLGVNNGVLDLERGEHRDARREDRMLRQGRVEFVPGAPAERFQAFLNEVFDSDGELISFIARALGYSLTGSTAEQVLFVAWRTGANGKSTLINVMRRIFGDYCRLVQPETLMSRDRGGTIPNDVARLRGVRFVPTMELEEGKKLAESLVKQLTGGDAITARFMRQEFFEFVPVAKFWIVTNHRPIVTGTDHAIWRRILLVPFAVTIPSERREKDLEERLMSEAPGILNWLLDGVKDWQAQGLAPLNRVLAATEQYRADMDRIGSFLAECTSQELGQRTKKTALYAAYCEWCKGSGIHAVRKMLFHEKLLSEHGLTIVKRDGYECYEGVLLAANEL